ncbi:MAG: PfkB family carbohydrate kinase, partial [Nanoarchaeota archaeon]
SCCHHDGWVYKVLPRKVKIVETTGAGDAFASAFVCGLIYSRSPDDCLRLASLNAESVISHYGSKDILLNRDSALRLLKKDGRHVSKVSAKRIEKSC